MLLFLADGFADPVEAMDAFSADGFPVSAIVVKIAVLLVGDGVCSF